MSATKITAASVNARVDALSAALEVANERIERIAVLEAEVERLRAEVEQLKAAPRTAPQRAPASTAGKPVGRPWKAADGRWFQKFVVGYNTTATREIAAPMQPAA